MTVKGPVDSEESLAENLEQLADRLLLGVPAAATRDAGLELAARANAIQSLAETVEEVRKGPDDQHVSWVERDARGNATLVRAPIDVGPALKVALWDAYDTVVLTSATLATGRPASFRYVRDRLGLAGSADVDEVALGSPFDYVRQARVIVRTDLPDPARDPAGYEAALPEAVLHAVRRTKGGAFVLFTSYESMRRTADAVRAHLEGDGLVVLVHGEDLPRTAMLERFRETNAVLFGVSSFWQGVDVPGDALRNVVIARLPFDVPSHPLARARQARVEREGKSAFEELSLPAAALRLKQGFGRLIRRATDKGIVVLLDPRDRDEALRARAPRQPAGVPRRARARDAALRARPRAFTGSTRRRAGSPVDSGPRMKLVLPRTGPAVAPPPFLAYAMLLDLVVAVAIAGVGIAGWRSGWFAGRAWAPGALVAFGALLFVADLAAARMAPKGLTWRRRLGYLAMGAAVWRGPGRLIEDVRLAVPVVLYMGAVWIALVLGGRTLSRAIATATGEDKPE